MNSNSNNNRRIIKDNIKIDSNKINIKVVKENKDEKVKKQQSKSITTISNNGQFIMNLNSNNNLNKNNNNINNMNNMNNNITAQQQPFNKLNQQPQFNNMYAHNPPFFYPYNGVLVPTEQIPIMFQMPPNYYIPNSNIPVNMQGVHSMQYGSNAGMQMPIQGGMAMSGINMQNNTGNNNAFNIATFGKNLIDNNVNNLHHNLNLVLNHSILHNQNNQLNNIGNNSNLLNKPNHLNLPIKIFDKNSGNLPYINNLPYGRETHEERTKTPSKGEKYQKRALSALNSKLKVNPNNSQLSIDYNNANYPRLNSSNHRDNCNASFDTRTHNSEANKGYKPYTLKEYKEISSAKVVLGKLGPNLGTKEWENRAEKLKKMEDYSSKIKQTNSVILKPSKETPQDIIDKSKKEKIENSKNFKATEYASKVLKPKLKNTNSSSNINYYENVNINLNNYNIEVKSNNNQSNISNNSISSNSSKKPSRKKSGNHSELNPIFEDSELNDNAHEKPSELIKLEQQRELFNKQINEIKESLLNNIK